MPELPTYLVIAFALLDVGCVTLAVVRARGVTATLAWVFAILALPVLGALAYLLLANPRVGRTRRLKRHSAVSVRSALEHAPGRGTSGPGLPELNGDDLAILNLVSSVTDLEPTRGNEVHLLAEEEGAFAAIEEALHGARRSIWAEYYIIRNDETGRRFIDVLARKAAEGVEVKLLYDAIGSLRLDTSYLRRLLEVGGSAEAFENLNPMRRLWTVHLRNHRKIIVVDGEQAFTGGMNIGDEYSGRARFRGAQHFLDSHMSLRGPAVAALVRTFAEDWHFATGDTLVTPAPPGPAAGGDSVVAVVPSGPDQEFNANSLLYFANINAARERCYLMSPYFIPDEATITALVGAALQGVDVRVLVPRKNDVRVAAVAAQTYFPVLARAGVRIFEYLPSMLHGKTLVADGQRGIVGSANVDIRSFRLNFEVGALVIDRAFGRQLEDRFLAYQEKSAEVTADVLEQRGFRRRLVGGAARLLSPLL